MIVVTPTLKAARVAADEIGTEAFSAAWMVHQHGWRWDIDGRWTRVEQGQVIGAVGATGRASGPHLHWGMNWCDVRIDPLLVLGYAAK